MTAPATRVFAVSADGLPAEVRAALADAFTLRDLPPGEGTLETWDTFDGRIWNAGAVLLARGDRWDFGARGGAWEPRLAARLGTERFAADFADEGLRAALAPLLGVRAVMRQGALAWVRRTTELLDAVDKVVCRVDWEQWTPADRGSALRLVVLRPLRGYDAECAQAQAAFAGRATVLPDVDPLLYVVERLAPVESDIAHVVVAPDQPARAAVSAMAGEMVRRARRCEAGVCDDLDPEFLHDYRVHLRKARSVLALLRGVFPPATTHRLKLRLGDIARRTNRLRDDDVYLLRRAEYEASLPPELRAGLEPLFAEWTAHRAGEQAAVARYLRSVEYRDAIEEVECVLAHPEAQASTPAAVAPAGPLIFAALAKRYRRLARLARDLDHETSDEAIHELRIQGKKLRYLLEFTRDLVPAEDRARLEGPLRRLQNRLGAFNDLSVQRRALLERAGRLSDPAQLLAIGGLAAVLHERQQTERSKVFARLAAVCDKDTRRWVRERFAAPGEEAQP